MLLFIVNIFRFIMSSAVFRNPLRFGGIAGVARPWTPGGVSTWSPAEPRGAASGGVSTRGPASGGVGTSGRGGVGTGTSDGVSTRESQEWLALKTPATQTRFGIRNAEDDSTETAKRTPTLAGKKDN